MPVTQKRRSPSFLSRTGRVSVSECPAPDCSSVGATIQTSSEKPRDYGRLRIVKRTDPRGYDYFWFGLGPMIETPGHSTDLEAVADGYVAVTPLHLDLTHDPSLAGLAELYA